MGMREEFEAWMVETADRFHPDFTRRGIEGEYQNVGIEHDWVIWQASRAAPKPKVCECPSGVRNITDGGHFPACTACKRRIGK